MDAPFNRATSFTIDNKNLETYKSFFGDNYEKFSLGSFSANFPVLEELTLNDMNTVETLDLSSCKKLTKLNLSKTTVKRVILPSKVK
nr:MAG TPA: RKS1, Disease resistance RPP13-like protein, RKS1, PLANT PROTEIN [Crassvirales sp.]